MNEQAGQQTHNPAAVRIRALTKKANNGDEKALAELRGLLGAAEWDSLVKQFGDMAKNAEKELLAKFTGKNALLVECIRRRLESMRAELSGPSPTPIERLLVQRVVASWLQVYHADCMIAMNLEKSLGTCEQLARLQDRAHKRFLSTVKTLATIRRLALPIKVDVNVAGTVTTKAPDRTSTPRRLLPIGSDN